MADKTIPTAGWQFDRHINLSVIVQLLLLASLIIGTWSDLQKQICLIQHDVTSLVQTQDVFQKKIERLTERNLNYEYRLRTMEKHLSQADIPCEIPN